MNLNTKRLRRNLQRWRYECPALLSYYAPRPRVAGIDPEVVRETWDAVADGAHNSNTDLTFWEGWFYLAHQTSPFHMGSRHSRMLLWRSRDARSWEKVTEFKAPEGEYRDPTFGQIRGRLFLYLLPNLTFRALPVTTVFTSSVDGTSWDPLVEAEPKNWLFWRPKTLDNETWYVTAYWHEHGRSALLKSKDGRQWAHVSQIYQGEGNDETDFEFLPDGRIIATVRLEGEADSEWGNASACTLLAVAEPPYERWSYKKSFVTRLDGPCLFPYNNRTYAIGRYQATRGWKFAELGGMYARKRTSLFLVEEGGLSYLTDLPSAGDTSYAGAVRQGDDLFVSYYTSPPERDITWFMGMIRPTNIRMARIDLPALERLALRNAGTTAGPTP